MEEPVEGGINRGLEWGQSQGVFLKVGDFLPGFSGMPRSSSVGREKKGILGTERRAGAEHTVGMEGENWGNSWRDG